MDEDAKEISGECQNYNKSINILNNNYFCGDNLENEIKMYKNDGDYKNKIAKQKYEQTSLNNSQKDNCYDLEMKD